MASAVVTAGRPVRKRRPASAASLTPASTLGLGIAMLWFSLLVLIPLAAIVVTASDNGLATYKETLSDPRTAKTSTPTAWWTTEWRSVELAGDPPSADQKDKPLTFLGGNRR